MRNDDKAWFAPKRYGYGAGLPIAWQGWALTAAFVIVSAGSGLFLAQRSPLAFAAVMIAALAVFLPVCAAKTRGGWHWRGD